MDEEDILQIIPDEDIPKLREIYKTHLPQSAYIYNYLESVTKWKTQCPDKNCVTLMAPHANWKSGTFVSIHEYSCYEILMYTLEEDCKTLCEALMSTKKIKWNHYGAVLYAVCADIVPKLLKVLNKTAFRILETGIADNGCELCDVYWIPKEDALKFHIECPAEVYIRNLDPSHANIVSSYWPHRYEGADKYIATMIEMGGGCGVFLKCDDTLVAWVVRNLMGLGVLQTADGHKRKGYGSLVTKALAKEIAEKGTDPLGTVLEDNAASQTLFRNLGFKAVEMVVYIKSHEMWS